MVEEVEAQKASDKKKKGLFTPVFVTPKPFVQCGVLGDTLRDNRERGM